MQRSILRKRISARLNTTAIALRIYSINRFNQEKFDITPEQYGVLSLIVDNNELYQRQLSEILLKDRANISRIIKILEEKALIIKTKDSNGRKIFKVKPTEKGLELRKKILSVTKNIRQKITKGITDEELEGFLTTLDKMFYNVIDKINIQI